MKKTGFLKQSQILIQRYLKIFFNDKQNLALTIAIPLLTILIVCLVASDDMFATKTDKDIQINDGYPILSWEIVDYQLDKDENEDETDEKDEESSEKDWDGQIPEKTQMMPADSDGNEYYISSPGDLQLIAKLKGEWLKKTYYLSNNINMNDHEIIPIGTDSEPFTGTFEGNGHIIRNFKIDAKNGFVGFFGKIAENGKVCNLGIEDAEITGNTECNNSGLIAGKIDDAVIENCYTSKCKIDLSGNNIGGIVGTVSGSDSTVRNCYSRADISVNGNNVGGIAGTVKGGNLQYIYFAGTLEDNGSDTKYFGGIAGCLDDEENSFYGIYDNEVCNNFKAIGAENNKSSDLKNANLEGWTTKKLQQNASLIRKLDCDIGEDEENGTFKNDGELANFGGTQTGLFMLACVAIFVGICNSIQEICKERNILKREYMTNLRLSSYMISKLAVQGMICAVQTVVILIIFYLSVTDKVYPSNGIIFPNSKLEVFVTMFLLTYASDAIALLISSIVKTSSTANTFIPIILIVQIVFSGVLFDLGKTLDTFAGIMISKWGIGALAATNRLNESRITMVMKNPELSLQMGDDMTRIKDLYVATASNLLKLWLILFAFVIACSIISGFILTGVKHDKR